MGVTEQKIKFTMVDAVSQGLADVNASVQGTTKQFERLGSTLQNMALGAGVATFGLSIIDSAKNWAAAVNDLEDKTGMAGESASKLLFIGQSVGLTGEDMAGAFTKMSKTAFAAHDAIVTASAAGKESDDVYSRFGIAINDSNGKLLDSEQIFKNVAARHREMSDGLEKTDMELAIFGKSGAKFNDLLNQSDAAMEHYIEIAQKMGLINDHDMSQAWEDATFKQNALRGALKGLEVQVGNELLPTLTNYTDQLTEAVMAYGTLDDSTKSYISTSAEAAVAFGTLGAGIQAVIFLGQPFADFVTWVNRGLKSMAVQAGITRLAMLGVLAIPVGIGVAAAYHGRELANHIAAGGEVEYDDLGNVSIKKGATFKTGGTYTDYDSDYYDRTTEGFNPYADTSPNEKKDNGVRSVDTSGGASAANKYDKMEARYRKLLEQIQSKITNETGTGLEKGTQSVNADLASMAEDITKINAQGIDTSALTAKMEEYRKVMIDRLTEDQKRTDALLIDATAQTNATLIDDKIAMANAEYQITLEELGKEFRDKKQSVTDKSSADAWYTAKKATAEKKLADDTRAAMMTTYADAVTYASLMVDLTGATVDASNSEQLKALKQEASYMREQLQNAKLTAAQRLEIEKDLTNNLQSQYKLNGQNLSTAFSEAARQLRTKTVDIAGDMVSTFDSGMSNIETNFTDMFTSQKSSVEALKDSYRDLGDTILNMIAKIFYELTIYKPLANYFGNLLSGIGGGGGSIGDTGTALSGYVSSFLSGSYAGGGLTSPGWSLVGEQGPELIDTSTPGRVYTASQTAAALSARNTISTPAIQLNVTNNTGSEVKAQNTDVKLDGQKYVIDIVLDAAQRNVNGFSKNLKTILSK